MQTIDNSANKFKNITTNGNTVVEGSVELVAIFVNTAGASSNTAKIYQDTTPDPQKVIGTINTAVAPPQKWEYGIPCKDGFLIVTATGTAPDMTVIYRDL